MRIDVRRENCGKLIDVFDTAIDVSTDWAEAPCGEKVCGECCEECERENMDGINYGGCPYKEDNS